MGTETAMAYDDDDAMVEGVVCSVMDLRRRHRSTLIKQLLLAATYADAALIDMCQANMFGQNSIRRFESWRPRREGH